MNEWMHITVEIDPEQGAYLLERLKAYYGMRDVDFCEMQDSNFGRVSWGPCPEWTESGYGEATDRQLKGQAT